VERTINTVGLSRLAGLLHVLLPLLEIFDEERGFEDFISMLLKMFALLFTVRSAATLFSQIFFMLLSCYGTAKYIYENVDLHPTDIDYEQLLTHE